MACLDPGDSLAECEHQRLVREDVDQAGRAVGAPVKHLYRGGREKGRSLVARDVQPVVEVSSHLVGLEALENALEGDALQELPG